MFFVKFLIALGAIVTVGPGHNEGGFEAVKEKGVKPALEQSIDESTPYNSGSLRNYKGNFGNE
jgi:hypothetical protein